MTLKPARTLVLATIALGASLSVASDADAASSKLPTVSRITPSTANIGETMTIRGTNFRVGKGKNTVVFKRDGKRAIFAKSEISTSRMLQVEVPEELSTDLSRTSAGAARPTRFRVRILAARFQRAFTASSVSPLITEATGTGVTPGTGVTIRTPGGDYVTQPVVSEPDCDMDGL
jgi:hypothetical protein